MSLSKRSRDADPSGKKLIKFTRRSKNFSPQIINQKIVTSGVECSTTDLSSDTTCIFEDALGSKTSISGIVFINYDVKHPNIMSYKDDNGHAVHRVNFSEQAVCEVLGPKGASTMKCSDKTVHEQERKRGQEYSGGNNQRYQGGGGW
jgi:hypothetical protein